MFEINIEKSWCDAVYQRSSVRSYAGAPDKEQLDRLGVLCRKLTWQGVTLRMFKGPGLRGIKGTDVYAVIVAKKGTPQEVEGFMGEALVLEATAMGLGSCWLGAMYYPDIINRNVNLQTDEEVHCVIALGKVSARPAFNPKRKDIVKVCGMNEAQLDDLGAWQKEAVLAARVAPSAINLQPWKITADKTSVSILEGNVLMKKYASLDRGICMLHATVGAFKAGRKAVWKKVDGGYQMKA